MDPLQDMKNLSMPQQIDSEPDSNNSERLTLNRVLIKMSKDSTLKTRYTFVENLFEYHANIIYEMIEWTLMPNKMAIRKKYTGKFQPLLYLSKDFIKDNWCFYEILFIYIKRHKFPLLSFFQFLQPQNYDASTIDTALGYFSQILLPFAKFGFSQSPTLLASLGIEDASKFGGIVEIVTEQVLTYIIQFAHYRPVYDFLMTVYLVGVEEEINFEPCKVLIDTIFEYCQNPNILIKFSEQKVLDQTSYETLTEEYESLENVLKTIKQILQNIEPEKNMTNRIKSILIALLRSNLIYYIIKEILSSSYVSEIMQVDDPQSPTSQFLSQSISYSPSVIREIKENKFAANKAFSLCDLNQSTKDLFLSTPLTLSRKKQAFYELPKNKFCLGQITQDQIIEVMLNILTYFVRIYDRLPENIKNASETNEDPLLQEIDEQFQIQILHLLDNMKEMNKIVYNEAKRNQSWIKFSSGQQIKSTRLVRFQYFQLLYQVMTITANYNHSVCHFPKKENQPQKIEEPPINLTSKKSKIRGFDIEDLHIIEIIEKYLQQNKWNNISHHLLQKIFHSLVITRPEYLINKIQEEKGDKTSEGLLAYLFQHFLQKQYIYLDTFRFTSQGNLHSLYHIAKSLAYSLNNNNKLIKLLYEFDGWEKFLIYDLKQYEEKTFPKFTEPSKQLRDSLSSAYGDIKAVDEMDSICKLAEDVTKQKQKWPQKNSDSRKRSTGNQKQ